MTVPSGPGVLGAPGDAPFDRVLVSAMADALPTAYRFVPLVED